MKLLSIILARSVWLVPVGDLNPRGIYLEPAIEALINRYSFIRKEDINPAIKDQLILEKGLFTTSKNIGVEISLRIHNDGLVADTKSSTTDSDEFLDDFLTWLQSEYGLEDYKNSLKKKVYVSEVYIESSTSLNLINPEIDSFLNNLSSQVSGHDPVPFELSSISCTSNPANHSKPTPFRLERAQNIPFEDNRYYSSGPFETDTHLNLLEEFESLLNK